MDFELRSAIKAQALADFIQDPPNIMAPCHGRFM